MDHRVDLNADLGEGFGAYRYGADEELIPLVSSANIACGAHGGDPSVMRRAAALAAGHGVVIGAHPGYPDIAGFGRRYMALSPREVTDSLLWQIGALDGICRAEGTRIRYVKPHGALYNAASRDRALAEAIVGAIRLYDKGLMLLCPTGSALAAAAEANGVRCAREFFADRAYNEDGSLVSRSMPGAVISDECSVCERVLKAVKTGLVTAQGGADISVRFDSICLHGDNPAAVELARAVRSALSREGVSIKPFAAGDN